MELSGKITAEWAELTARMVQKTRFIVVVAGISETKLQPLCKPTLSAS